ncbi:MAG TPA: polysaccharide deacetylase family protein [Gemmatimonadaceae bacterium]|nr:polysaccharide deacetylase family protein [Gemmatimonadaceae bacterium]
MKTNWVCLMYHDVVADRDALTASSGYFAVTAHAFARHLELLREKGLGGCAIATALEPSTVNRVAISFDDGNAGQGNVAFPALVAAGMTATFFITTGWVGRPGFVSWDQLREMRDAGMAIESHTHSHPFLSEIPETRLRDELRQSREMLGEQLGEPPTMIALPGGDAPQRELWRLFAEEGYESVATSRWGMNQPLAGGKSLLTTVRRCTVRGELSDREFVAIAKGNPWLRTRKRLREEALAAVRRILGPTRYAKRRKQLLNAASGLR